MTAPADVALFSGGIGSWAAARRLVDYGSRPVLLFTDTTIEDEDLYRFLDDSAENLGIPITRIADGRDPWEVFKDERFLGNTRADPCSKILKRKLARKWIDERWDAAVVAIGIDWTEAARFDRAKKLWLPHTLVAPLIEPPYFSKADLLDQAKDAGLDPPRLYGMGFAHNNCGGFCVKQGQAGFLRLLRSLPERYAEHEAKEEAFRKFIGKDVAILRDRRGGTTKPLTLRQLRESHRAADPLDAGDFGGCGCML